MGDFICQRLGLNSTIKEYTEWQTFVDAIINPEHEVNIALVGKYAELTDSYISMSEALKHGGATCKTKVSITYISAEKFEKNTQNTKDLDKYDGIFVPYGFDQRGAEGKIAAIQHARENNIPFLGICYGFQLAAIEYARNVCNLKDANSTEINSDTPHPVIDVTPEQKQIEYKDIPMRLGTHKINIQPNTIAAILYQQVEAMERHRHRFEVNPNYIEILKKNGLVFSGKSADDKKMETLELPDKYFFFATQFHGEFKSRPGKPSPAYRGFIKACIDKKLGKPKPTFT
jgi:CTP synthase